MLSTDQDIKTDALVFGEEDNLDNLHQVRAISCTDGGKIIFAGHSILSPSLYKYLCHLTLGPLTWPTHSVT